MCMDEIYMHLLLFNVYRGITGQVIHQERGLELRLGFEERMRTLPRVRLFTAVSWRTHQSTLQAPCAMIAAEVLSTFKDHQNDPPSTQVSHDLKLNSPSHRHMKWCPAQHKKVSVIYQK